MKDPKRSKTLLIQVDPDKLLAAEPIKEAEIDRLFLAFELVRESGIVLRNAEFKRSGEFKGSSYNFYEIEIDINPELLYEMEEGSTEDVRIDYAFKNFDSPLYGQYGIINYGEIKKEKHASSHALQGSN